jgi:hypothetical protein
MSKINKEEYERGYNIAKGCKSKSVFDLSTPKLCPRISYYRGWNDAVKGMNKKSLKNLGE